MPSEWRALPFDDDGEDDRDDLMEYLGANSLPTLLVMDPIRGKDVLKIIHRRSPLIFTQE